MSLLEVKDLRVSYGGIEALRGRRSGATPTEVNLRPDEVVEQA